MSRILTKCEKNYIYKGLDLTVEIQNKKTQDK